MQLKDLVNPIRDMTDEQLKEKLRDIRHNRTTVRPAAEAKVKRAAKKESNKKMSEADKLIAALSPEQLQLLMSQIQGDS
jgi:ribosomal protein L29